MRAMPGLALGALGLLVAPALAQVEQCRSFTPVSSAGVSAVAAAPATVFLYALPDDCPSACTICSAGCLFCASSGYTDPSAVPDRKLPYSTSASGADGSWLALASTASCVPGGGVGAMTGSLVRTIGLKGTYSSSTGTRVSSKTSACGTWELVKPTARPPAPPGGYRPSPPPPPPPPPSTYDWQLPSAVLTPGDVNPDVTEATQDVTICCHYRGAPDCSWSTSSIRPPASYTTGLKEEQLAGDYSAFVPVWGAALSGYEEDHLIPLELGGNPKSRANLWPQPHPDAAHGAHQSSLKDALESAITEAVCAGETPLRVAQKEIAGDWPAAYRKYVMRA